MNSKKARKLPQLSDFPVEQVTPAVLILLEICHEQAEEIQALRDEIARLKGQKPRPRIRPSKLEGGDDKNGRSGRGNQGKGSKTKRLKIHKTVVIPPDNIPEGSRFKGYQDYTVQDIRIELQNIRYRLERWETPSGEAIIGQLPDEVKGHHFGADLRTYIIYQYHHAHVTQPLILEQLREWGIEISAGEVSAILTKGMEAFHAEKEALLAVGLRYSRYVQVDDTGARHKGKNGYCTHIGNEQFAYFASTDSKSRINFLALLRAGHKDYVINDAALAYMRRQELPKTPLDALAAHVPKTLSDKKQWQDYLKQLGITTPRHVRIATEGALLGSAIEHGVLHPDLGIISDDAGQFDVLLHALCWIHAERVFAKLIGFNDPQRQALDACRSAIWALYGQLKAYKAKPNKAKKTKLEAQFDTLCATKTCFATLNSALKRLYGNKAGLLLVLDRPDLPLHNNLSENDIREYVKKRKISGSTRSNEGRRCRDTFTSLKKTCRKHGISFWAYLSDRIRGTGRIPPLPELVYQHALLLSPGKYPAAP
jgi:hypothetical protein